MPFNLGDVEQSASKIILGSTGTWIPVYRTASYFGFD